MTTTTNTSTTNIGTTDAGTGSTAERRYLAPNGFTRHVFNPLIAGLTRLGVSVWGSRVLEVPGRTTGEIRTTPVNLLTVDCRQYLVAPRAGRPAPPRAGPRSG